MSSTLSLEKRNEFHVKHSQSELNRIIRQNISPARIRNTVKNSPSEFNHTKAQNLKTQKRVQQRNRQGIICLSYEPTATPLA